MNILKMMGLMRVSEADAEIADWEKVAPDQCAGIAALNGTIDDLRDDLTGQRQAAAYWKREAYEARDEAAELKSSFNQRLADAVQDYQVDALAWRKKKRKDADYETNRRVRKK